MARSSADSPPNQLASRLALQIVELLHRTEAPAGAHERIHRSNLIGMGIYPLEFAPGTTRRDLALDGTETLAVDAGELRVGIDELCLRVRRAATVRVHAVRCRVDSAAELAYLARGGALRYMVGRTLAASGGATRAGVRVHP